MSLYGDLFGSAMDPIPEMPGQNANYQPEDIGRMTTTAPGRIPLGPLNPITGGAVDYNQPQTPTPFPVINQALPGSGMRVATRGLFDQPPSPGLPSIPQALPGVGMRLDPGVIPMGVPRSDVNTPWGGLPRGSAGRPLDFGMLPGDFQLDLAEIEKMEREALQTVAARDMFGEDEVTDIKAKLLAHRGGATEDKPGELCINPTSVAPGKEYKWNQKACAWQKPVPFRPGKPPKTAVAATSPWVYMLGALAVGGLLWYYYREN